MSTRRARIKAVVALPPRRKNADNNSKASTCKDNQEKPLRSPRTPKNDVRSPRSSTRTPPPLIPLDIGPKTPTKEGEASPVRVQTPVNTESRSSTPKSDQVTVITTAAIRNVFASPLPRGSPDRRQNSLEPSPKLMKSVDNTMAPNSVEGEKDNHISNDYSSSHALLESTPEDTEMLNDIPNSSAKSDQLKNEILLENGEVSFNPIVPLPSPAIKVRPKLRPVPRLALHSRNSIQAKSSPDRRSGASPSPLSSPKNFRNDIATPPPQTSEIIGTPNRNDTNSVSEDNNPNILSPKDVILDSILSPPPQPNYKPEAFSEVGNASFDPITPLPMHGKVRPKIRPVPRLAPHRRNSVQGSASESEDESRRASHGPPPAPPPPSPLRQRHDSHTSHSTLHSALNRESNRNRNDSVCSSVSQVATQPPPATSPVKDKHLTKTRRSEINRRSWSRRREMKRDALTMYDLIFFNPTTNPIVPDQDEMIAKEANAKEEAERKATDKESEQAKDTADTDTTDKSAPVPQIKLGPNGEIILDQQSLVINQSESNRKVSQVVREGAWGAGGGGKYSRAARTADWSAPETVRFYRALGAIGTDFTLMAPLFPGRNRRDLYLKFKKEEKLNGGQVDMALRSATSWDLNGLQKEFKEERAAAAKQAEMARQRLLQSKQAERERLKTSRNFRVRPSRAAKALESSMRPGAGSQTLTADEFVERHLETHNLTKKPNPRKSSEKPTESNYAMLTMNSNSNTPKPTNIPNDLATITRLDPWSQSNQVSLNEVAGVPKNIETGSLVVLRVNDPASPSKTMLQTYIAHGSGKLTPVALPSTFLNSVVGYMKKGPLSNSSSPRLMSPNSVTSQDSRSATSSVIQVNPSPSKRQRHSSYTITSL